MGDGTPVEPPLRRGSSQGKYGSCTKGLDCDGERDWKIGERELAGDQWQVRQGTKLDTWMTDVSRRSKAGTLCSPPEDSAAGSPLSG